MKVLAKSAVEFYQGFILADCPEFQGEGLRRLGTYYVIFPGSLCPFSPSSPHALSSTTHMPAATAGSVLSLYGSVMLALGTVGWAMHNYSHYAQSSFIAGLSTAVAALICARFATKHPIATEAGKVLTVFITVLTGWRASLAIGQPDKFDVLAILIGMATASVTTMILLIIPPVQVSKVGKVE